MQKVLVVDDETFVVDIVKTTLSRAGYDVVTARDGVTGLAIAGDEQPSLVLLDADMPRLDGFEALERLQRDGRTNAIPVVMMTGRRTEADVRRGIALGAKGYLGKPFSPQDLLTRVQATIRREPKPPD